MSDTDLEDIVIDNTRRIEALEKFHNKNNSELKPTHSKYQTNFIKGPKGNSIAQGSELIIKIKGAESVTGRISIRNQVQMIDQSTATDEDNNTETINFVLKKRYRVFGKRDLPKGTYSLLVWWWDKDTMSSGTYTDEFEII